MSGWKSAPMITCPSPLTHANYWPEFAQYCAAAGLSRRPHQRQQDELTFGPFRFEPDTRALYRDGSEVKLSRAEFELLSVFVSHPNKVLSRDQIMDNLRARERDPFDRSIDVRVTRLRHKIEEDPAEPRLIRTVWGVGYQFTPRGQEQ